MKGECFGGAGRLGRLLRALPPDWDNYLRSEARTVLFWGPEDEEAARDLRARAPRHRLVRREALAADFPAHDCLLVAALPQLDQPLEGLRRALAGCRDVALVLVPHAEHPLAGPHRAQFRRESFPARVGAFRLASLEALPAAPGRPGEELLAVYVSPALEETTSPRVRAERAKWDAFYDGLADVTETDSARTFHAEFTDLVRGLLPGPAATLEVGCGAGSQGLALARTGRYRADLMDISPRALETARALFAREGLTTEAVLGNAFEPGEARYDLVFNAGALEHYTLQEQAGFLRGMASRSRRFVLALVPNPSCYWYWIWRLRGVAEGNWPFGKECPPADLSEAFAAAGLRFLGHTHLGAAWTEDLIAHVRGLDDRLREDLLAVHRSALLHPAQKCYLLAALGVVGEDDAPLPAPWTPGARPAPRQTSELLAAVADTLALRIQVEQRAEAEARRQRAELADLGARLARLQDEHDRLQVEYARVHTGPSARLARRVQRVVDVVLPAESWRRDCGRVLYNGVRKAGRLARRCLRPFARPPKGLAQALRQARRGPRPVVFLPSIPWTTALFQRPQHLAREFARRGHPVVYDCTGTTQDVDGLEEIEPNLFLFRGDSRYLHALPAPLLWTFTYNYHLADAYPAEADVVYDWIDDLAVFDYDPAFLRANHGRALREAAAVFSVARRLHEEAARARPDALYLPNGVQYEHFAAEGGPAPADDELRPFLESRKPLAGYYGAVASWFDFDLVEAVANARRDWNFLVIGPNFDGTLDSKPLFRSCPNVRWVGPRDYRTLPGYLRLFDVATIPFAINDITRATSPLKLYEYFAGGKPVVTTPMPECMSYPEVHIARDAREFSAALDRARAEGACPRFRQRLRELARQNSWAERVGAALAHLAPPEGRRAAA